MDTQFLELCADSIPKLFGLFDPGIAPTLLYYSYIPIILSIGFFAIVVFYAEKKSLFSKIFLALSTSFIFWVLNIFIQWIGVYHWFIYRSWQVTALFEILIPIFSVLLMYVFIHKGSTIPKAPRIILSLIFLTTLVFLPTNLNIASYNFEYCEGNIGYLWYFIYAFEIISFIWIACLGIYQYLLSKKTNTNNYQLLWFTGGLLVFLGFFSGANIYGEITQQYTVNLIGPIGMVIFLGVVVFLTIKYKMLRLKLFATQVLIYICLILILSLLFVNNLAVIHIITAVTGFLFLCLGMLLIQSVRREAEERQRLEQIKLELEAANDKLKILDASKNEFLSFATHQLRSPLTSLKWGLNAVSDGIKDKPDMLQIVEQLRETAGSMIETVNDLLDISKIEQGGLVMSNEPIDLVQLLDQLSEEFRITAGTKQLGLTFTTDLPVAIISGDKTKLRQVFVNIIDNAIKYTATGSITISLKYDATANTFITDVTDTGPGISPEELVKLFEKFIRGNAGKSSKGGSGLGLYLGKRIVELHHGSISVTSPGLGKGSTFSVILPKPTL